MADLAAAYTAQETQVSFDIQGGGSHLGQTLVEAGQVDIGLVSWPPPELADHVRQVVIAQDGIAIVLHAENQLPDLSLQDLREIFSGRLIDWRELDGPPLPIQVVSREDGSGTRAAFEALAMAGQAVTPTAIVLPNSRAVVDFVAQNPNAIAYVSFSFIDDEIRAVPIEGVSPTVETVSASSYRLRRDFSLIVPAQGKPEVDRFVDFVLSPAGQAVVAEKWGGVN